MRSRQESLSLTFHSGVPGPGFPDMILLCPCAPALTVYSDKS